MNAGAQRFCLGLGLLALATPGQAQPAPPAGSASNRALGDTLKFLSQTPKPAPHRPVRRQTADTRRAPQFILVPVLGPFGFSYVQVPVYPRPSPPPPPRVIRVPVIEYRPTVVYRPVYAYPTVLVPAYLYRAPVD
jgi:hypothetical protein